jgi:hypothetical protein
MASTPMFDHEKLDVYQLELKFLTWVTQFLVRIVAMLTKLVERFDPELYRVRENELGVMQPFEDDEHENERNNR